MKKIVTIGGGTGSFTLLSGLKDYAVDISAVVSMADNGGSTGRLRDELGVLPPGDVRQCLVALSNSSETWRELMNYRFPARGGSALGGEVGGLAGHNFGNLLLSALEKIGGNFTNGLREAAKILNIKGWVLPVSEEKMNLAIELKNGEVVVGEKHLDDNKNVQKYGIKKVFLKPRVGANQKVIQDIEKADLIILGPGDHYGSIIPNLLVSGIPEAIQKSKAIVIYNCNLTNKRGETEKFDLDTYSQEINKYLGGDRIDIVIYPSGRPTKEMTARYERKEGKGSIVSFDKNKLSQRPYKIIKADVTSKTIVKKNSNDLIAETRSFIRHDSKKLAKVMMLLAEQKEYKKMIKEVL